MKKEAYKKKVLRECFLGKKIKHGNITTTDQGKQMILSLTIWTEGIWSSYCPFFPKLWVLFHGLSFWKQHLQGWKTGCGAYH